MELMDVPRLLLGSLVLRPYVFGFLLLHLLGASAFLGWRRTAVFTLVTWGVALVAEHSSIRTGIPFGWYYYIPRTADRELWIAGVPFFDSLSFSFLLVASYGLAWFLQAGRPEDRIAPEGNEAVPGVWSRPGRVRHLVLTSLLFVLIDIVIDPVALRGDRWFLGQVYGYPEPGLYFGVPLANFLGWGVVGATATALYHWMERRLFETPLGMERRLFETPLGWKRRLPVTAPRRFAGRALLCPGLYFIVLAFNLAVTAALGEWGLLLSGVALTLPVLLWTAGSLVGPRAFAWWPRAAGTRARGARA
ncbi:MAG TPA: carotenoid biosynthesis protein [Candidatus Methylomirabilis sp.]|jgi:putative membrane protein